MSAHRRHRPRHRNRLDDFDVQYRQRHHSSRASFRGIATAPERHDVQARGRGDTARRRPGFCRLARAPDVVPGNGGMEERPGVPANAGREGGALRRRLCELQPVRPAPGAGPPRPHFRGGRRASRFRAGGGAGSWALAEPLSAGSFDHRPEASDQRPDPERRRGHARRIRLSDSRAAMDPGKYPTPGTQGRLGPLLRHRQACPGIVRGRGAGGALFDRTEAGPGVSPDEPGLRRDGRTLYQ